ncbi:MAG: divalent-cation tolerance protein CutA [Gemmatimonadales bacterium]|nr:MAG: divalent-cation tolerance protein CutA [Gemmatimonadales bacterium]
MNAPGVRVVLVTLPDAASAGSMARILVEEGHAACGSIVPGVSSIYRWEGKIHEDTEVLLVLKTSEPALAGLLRRVPELHSYDVPEVLALPVTEGHPPYLDWVADITAG